MVALHIIRPTALPFIIVLIWMMSGASPVRAQSRRVAVVNAAADQSAGELLSARVRAALVAHPELSPVPPGDLARALESVLAPRSNDQASLDSAAAELARAQDALARFAYADALTALSTAEASLLATAPTAQSSALLAQIAFQRGRILLRGGNLDSAIVEFALARRLAPERDRLDPSVYPPEVVQAFEAAGAQALPEAVIEVTSLFDGATVYVDGKRVGSTPVVVHVVPGIHYVSGTFADTLVASERVVLGRETRPVKLRFADVTLDDRARNWRLGLLGRAPLVARTAEPVAELVEVAAELAGADAVIMVANDAAGTLYLAAHDERTAVSIPWRPATNTAIDSVLAALAPAPLGAGQLPPADQGPKPWWRTTWARAGIGAGIAVSILTIAVISLTPPDQDQSTVGAVCCIVLGRSGAAP